jgi:hypothetical protein
MQPLARHRHYTTDRRGMRGIDRIGAPPPVTDAFLRGFRNAASACARSTISLDRVLAAAPYATSSTAGGAVCRPRLRWIGWLS